MDIFWQWLQDLLKGTVVPVIVLWITGSVFVRLALRFSAKALKRTHLAPSAHTLIHSILRIILYVLFGCAIAASLGIDITGIVALASVLTLAISLSLQNALSNIFGGCALLYTKPFSVGDFVEINGQTGTVKEIGLTYTQLTTPDGKIIFLPNHQVASGEIVNNTTAGVRRVEITLTLPFSVSFEQAQNLLLSASNLPKTLQSPSPFAYVKAYKHYGVVYSLYIWCRAKDYWDVLFDANANIKNALERENISIVFLPRYPE